MVSRHYCDGSMEECIKYIVILLKYMKNIRRKSLCVKKWLHLLSVGVLILIVLFAFFGKIFLGNSSVKNKKNINGLMMLIEFERIEGILQWEKALDEKGITALVSVQSNILEKYPEDFTRIANKGYEIAGGYDGAPFWDMPYEEQYQHMKDSQEFIKKIIGKNIRVFGSRYFAYDENTLKAADALGIEYILGRGTKDIEAVIYAPKEYKVKIISVSNVNVGEPMGRGSLCDYSLWARGADPAEFGKIVEENIVKNPTNMILVSHAYLGGTRLEWWNEYQKALTSPDISWKWFDQWITEQSAIVLPNVNIPLNKEVKYGTPNPAKPIDAYEPIPGLTSTENDSIIQPDAPSVCQ